MQKIRLFLIVTILTIGLSLPSAGAQMVVKDAPSLTVRVLNEAGDEPLKRVRVTMEEDVKFGSSRERRHRTNEDGIAYFAKEAFRGFRFKKRLHEAEVHTERYDGRSVLSNEIEFKIKITVKAVGAMPESHMVILRGDESKDKTITLPVD